MPVASQERDGRPDLPARTKMLLVFLPGRGTTGQDFARQGFIDALPAGSPVDTVTVDLTFPYYTGRIATRRLHDDIVAPARARGYRRVWLVGCSMGGLGAIMYAHEYPGEVSGIVALAPYLGEKNVVAEIEAAGGPARWQPKEPLADDDFQRRLWLAIRAERFDQPGRVPFVLGYGTDDRFRLRPSPARGAVAAGPRFHGVRLPRLGDVAPALDADAGVARLAADRCHVGSARWIATSGRDGKSVAAARRSHCQAFPRSQVALSLVFPLVPKLHLGTHLSGKLHFLSFRSMRR